MCLLINGSWNAVKIKVNGNMPQTLKFTQIASDWVLQIISFKIANKIKKNAHLLLSLFQPIWSNWNADLKKNSKKFFFKKILPPINANAKMILIIVGFMYKKIGLLKNNSLDPDLVSEIAQEKLGLIHQGRVIIKVD